MTKARAASGFSRIMDDASMYTRLLCIRLRSVYTSTPYRDMLFEPPIESESELRVRLYFYTSVDAFFGAHRFKKVNIREGSIGVELYGECILGTPGYM